VKCRWDSERLPQKASRAATCEPRCGTAAGRIRLASRYNEASAFNPYGVAELFRPRKQIGRWLEKEELAQTSFNRTKHIRKVLPLRIAQPVEGDLPHPLVKIDIGDTNIGAVGAAIRQGPLPQLSLERKLRDRAAA
jgi:hypothetical protein